MSYISDRHEFGEILFNLVYRLSCDLFAYNEGNVLYGAGPVESNTLNITNASFY